MTTVLVTHDIDEAIYMGNKVIIMSAKPGVIKDIINVELINTKAWEKESFKLLVFLRKKTGFR